MTVDELIIELQKQSAAGNGGLDVRYCERDKMDDFVQHDVNHLQLLDCDWRKGVKVVNLTEYLASG